MTFVRITFVLTGLVFANAAGAGYEQSFHGFSSVPVRMIYSRTVSPGNEVFLQTAEEATFHLRCEYSLKPWTSVYYLRVSTSFSSVFDEGASKRFYIEYESEEACRSIIEATVETPRGIEIKLLNQNQVQIRKAAQAQN